MTPAARAQAAIELLDAIILSARDGGAAADTLIARYFKTRRYAGSKDRRAVREFVYSAIRRAGERPESGRAALLGLAEARALFDGTPHGPASMAEGEPVAEAGVAPRWLTKRLAASVARDELPALLDRAPLDLRVNRLKATRDEVLALIPDALPGELAPDALRLPEGSAIEGLPAWEAGLIEIQDEGSQLIALACDPPAGGTVVDLCAGAGGKTLALAANMAGQGRLIACDVDRARLSRLAPRAVRAGATIETRLLDPNREAHALGDLSGVVDAVLVDAPCSGTGTWRRNPEARWRLTPDRLKKLTALQTHILDVAAPLVRPGGRLVYAVCSLLAEEGADQIAAFLVRHPEWRADSDSLGFGRPQGAGRLLTPAHDRTDGFFVARLTCPC
jgi:16S rRNA (cytosine967-C5)-methyltransferase